MIVRRLWTPILTNSTLDEEFIFTWLLRNHYSKPNLEGLNLFQNCLNNPKKLVYFSPNGLKTIDQVGPMWDWQLINRSQSIRTGFGPTFSGCLRVLKVETHLGPDKPRIGEKNLEHSPSAGQGSILKRVVDSSHKKIKLEYNFSISRLFDHNLRPDSFFPCDRVLRGSSLSTVKEKENEWRNGNGDGKRDGMVGVDAESWTPRSPQRLCQRLHSFVNFSLSLSTQFMSFSLHKYIHDRYIQRKGSLV